LNNGGQNALDMVWEISSQFSNLLMQELEVGTILGFLQPCKLQSFVGFFGIGVGESIMDTNDHF
jgi:hypothetical protein